MKHYNYMYFERARQARIRTAQIQRAIALVFVILGSMLFISAIVYSRCMGVQSPLLNGFMLLVMPFAICAGDYLIKGR